ncbi:MAG: hypothetical protein EBR82_83835 [Caulobacteraceae bacterium]|nr:hypothetical protein [Caulobacteraceae bacterium]
MTQLAYKLWLAGLSLANLYVEQANCELVMRIAMNHTVRDSAADKLRLVLAELDAREQRKEEKK